MIPFTCGACNDAKYASSWVWIPLSTRGRLVCWASHGRVFFQVSFGDVPANSDFPMPPPSLGLLADPDWTAEVIGRPEATFFDLSSSSLLPGTGASRVRTTNLMLGILLMRASMSSLFFRSICA